MLLTGSTALAAVAFLRLDRLVAAAPLQPGEEVLSWLDQRAELPPPARSVIGQQLVWEELDAWITPNDKFFTIKHFGQPTDDIQAWRLDISGLVGKQTVRDFELTTPFARAMSVADAMNRNNLLCYEMNGESLPAEHGAPVRLLAPGWYGVAT